jgi:hypothetical protein
MISILHQLSGITLHRTRSFVVLRYTIKRFRNIGPAREKIEQRDEHVVRSWSGLWLQRPYASLAEAEAAIDAFLEQARHGPFEHDPLAWTDDFMQLCCNWGTQDDSDLAYVSSALETLLVDPDEVHVNLLRV